MPVHTQRYSLGWKRLLRGVFFWAGLTVWTVIGAEPRSSNWRAYTVNDGLAESFCSAISPSQRNEIWVQHTEPALASWLDGYTVHKRLLSGLPGLHLAENRVGQLWSATPDSILERREESWQTYPIGEIKGTPRTHPPILLPLRQGHVLFLMPDRLMELNIDAGSSGQITLVRDARQTGLGLFSDMIPAADGGIWVAGKHGLAKISTPHPADPSAVWEEFGLATNLAAQDLQHVFEDDQGGLTMVAESTRNHKSIIVYFDGKEWSSPPVPAEDARMAWRGADGSFWALAPRSLRHFENKNGVWLNTDEHLAAHYFDASIELGGVFWVATSEGLFRYALPTWRTLPDDNSNVPVQAMRQERDGPMWLMRSNYLSRFQNEQWKDFHPGNLSVNLPANEPLYTLANGVLVTSAHTNLLQFDPHTEQFSLIAHPSHSNLKPLGVLTNGLLCVQILGATNGPNLETFDGKVFQPLADLPANWNLGAELNVFFTSQNGTIWIGGPGGLAFYRDQKWARFDAKEGAAPDNVSCLMDLADGKLWCGTRDKVWQFDGKAWSVLQSGLEHVNNFSKSDDGSVWVAVNNGLARFFRGEWVVNGVEEGLSSATIHQVLQDHRGRVWAATAAGLNIYHPDADTEPPQTFIEKSKESGNAVEGPIQFFFGGRDKWKRTASDRLLFSYRLDEQEWSPFKPDHAVGFSDLTPGTHFFQVRAMDRNWNVDPKPVVVDILIPLPWYEETRLVWIASIGGVVALFFAALAFNRHRRLVRSYAEVEKIVALRTEQLDKANQQLFQGQKMNALGTLAAGIAHDFNSILSIIKGSAQIIEGNLENQDKVKTRLDRIKTAVDQGASIVKAMLGFSRSTKSETTACDVNAIAAETIELLGDRFQRDAQVQFQPGPGLPEVITTKDYLQQILLNFVLNAAEALDGPGKIMVRTGVVSFPATDLVLASATSGPHVFIAVQDFGCGIEAEILPRIFEPFFTTKSFSAKRGTGLGLSMVYELAKAMGAGLKVQSQPGQGSTFTLFIPVNPPPAK